MKDIPLWHDDRIQFARLLSELEAIGAFTPAITAALETEMDLDAQRLFELVERAQTVFDQSKAGTLPDLLQFPSEQANTYVLGTDHQGVSICTAEHPDASVTIRPHALGVTVTSVTRSSHQVITAFVHPTIRREYDLIVGATTTASSGDDEAPTFARVPIDQAFVDRVLAMAQVNVVHGLAYSIEWDSIDWGPDARVAGETLTVDRDGDFWFTANHKHQDHTWETRAVRVMDLIAAIARAKGAKSTRLFVDDEIREAWLETNEAEKVAAL